jgi:hypothetical protein
LGFARCEIGCLLVFFWRFGGFSGFFLRDKTKKTRFFFCFFFLSVDFLNSNYKRWGFDGFLYRFQQKFYHSMDFDAYI